MLATEVTAEVARLAKGLTSGLMLNFLKINKLINGKSKIRSRKKTI